MKIESNEFHTLKMKDIQLHKESVSYLNEVFSQYESDQFRHDLIIKNPIIHLYAEKDTRNIEGELNGYGDSLFCKVYIFDPNNRAKYYAGICDSIDVMDASLWQVKVFKDGSTIMIFRGEHTFDRLTSLVVRRVRE